jgi:hypothetical protein
MEDTMADTAIRPFRVNVPEAEPTELRGRPADVHSSFHSHGVAIQRPSLSASQ